ncbi:hypothetical protein EDB86DRAFT_1100232 [Lactarius hatsudake]|nr:hypothetical protein EDB86DRAFT_1100232 [Lactarius hatsudake]
MVIAHYLRSISTQGAPLPQKFQLATDTSSCVQRFRTNGPPEHILPVRGRNHGRRPSLLLAVYRTTNIIRHSQHAPPVPLSLYTILLHPGRGKEIVPIPIGNARPLEAGIWTAALCATQTRLISVKRGYFPLFFGIYCDRTNRLECLIYAASFWLVPVMYAGLPSLSSSYSFSCLGFGTLL